MDNGIRRWRRYERCEASVKEAILHEIATSDLSIKEISEKYFVNSSRVKMWLYRIRKSQEKGVSLQPESVSREKRCDELATQKCRCS